MKFIIKIGTNAIFDCEKQIIKENIIDGIAKDVQTLLKKGNEVIIVTSGAVGCGKKFIKGNGELGLKQAQAAVGQPILMENYRKHFSNYNLNVAQFLLTSDDLNNEQKLKNIKETYNNLIMKVIPIVNENDTTTTKELSFGDNDTLAAQLLLSLNFDILIILTEIGALIKNQTSLTKSNSFDTKYYDSLEISNNGFGGLKSKLDSAKKVVGNNKTCIIAKAGDSINDILNKKVIATIFV
jgi:glutamate 5-kinase